MFFSGSNYSKLVTFYVFFLWFDSFSKSVLPTHFLNEGLLFWQMILGTVALFGGQLFLLLTLKKLNARLSWRLALLSTITYVLLVSNIYSEFQFYVASVIGGFALFFFFVFYNIAHFEATDKKRTGYSSAIMFAAMPIVGMIAPFSAGFLAEIDFRLVWLLSVIFFFIPMFFVNKQVDFKINYTVTTALNEITSTRVFLFLEGIWEALIIGVIPVYSLFFLDSPLQYGTFLAYLALVGVIANIVLGKTTDKLQKRVIFLYPLTIIMAFTTMLFPFATSSIWVWIGLVSIINFLVPLFWNVTTAMVVDAHPNLKLAIPGREIMLAVGRLVGLLMVLVSFLVEEKPVYIFFALGLILFLYPVILYWNTKVSKRFSYL